jgi:hypothetical protein
MVERAGRGGRVASENRNAEDRFGGARIRVRGRGRQLFARPARVGHLASVAAEDGNLAGADSQPQTGGDDEETKTGIELDHAKPPDVDWNEAGGELSRDAPQTPDRDVFLIQ